MIRRVADADPSQVEEMRREFFRRTRTLVAVFYAALAAAAIAATVFAASRDAVRATVALIAGIVAALALFGVSPRFRISARATRWFIVIAAIGGAVTANLMDGVESRVGASAVWGAFAGFCFGTIVGIARIRRRLARDDELLLRQKQLGFDPERPFDWLRGDRRSPIE